MRKIFITIVCLLTMPLCLLAQNNTNDKTDFTDMDFLINSYDQSSEEFYLDIDALNKKEREKISALIDNELKKSDVDKDFYGAKTIVAFSLGNMTQAYSNVITALDNEKENGFLYYILGTIKLQAKEYQTSLQAYNSAIKYGFDYALTYKQRGKVKGYMDDFKGAIADYNSVIAKDSTDYEAYYLRGIAKNYLKDYNGAAIDLTKTITLNDTSASAYNYRGVVYTNVEDYGSALKDFEKALKIDNNHPYTYNNIGLIKQKLGDNKGAIEFFSKAISLDASHADAYFNRGKSKYELEEYSGAKEDISSSIQLNYSNPEAHYYLALCLIKQKGKKSNKELEDSICNELNVAAGMNHKEAKNLLNALCSKGEK
jgi:Lipoprotein NlpI, contains TPR repeats